MCVSIQVSGIIGKILVMSYQLTGSSLETLSCLPTAHYCITVPLHIHVVHTMVVLLYGM